MKYEPGAPVWGFKKTMHTDRLKNIWQESGPSRAEEFPNYFNEKEFAYLTQFVHDSVSGLYHAYLGNETGPYHGGLFKQLQLHKDFYKNSSKEMRNALNRVQKAAALKYNPLSEKQATSLVTNLRKMQHLSEELSKESVLKDPKKRLKLELDFRDAFTKYVTSLNKVDQAYAYIEKHAKYDSIKNAATQGRGSISKIYKSINKYAAPMDAGPAFSATLSTTDEDRFDKAIDELSKIDPVTVRATYQESTKGNITATQYYLNRLNELGLTGEDNATVTARQVAAEYGAGTYQEKKPKSTGKGKGKKKTPVVPVTPAEVLTGGGAQVNPTPISAPTPAIVMSGYTPPNFDFRAMAYAQHLDPATLLRIPYVVDPADLMKGRNRRAERRATASMAGLNASDFFRQNIGTARIGNYVKARKNAYNSASSKAIAQWFLDHEDTMRRGKWTPPEEESSLEKISKVLPSLVRPLINLIKSLGSMAAESAKATQAMSVLSSALGNPFEEGTLAGITEWGSSFGDMSGSFISGVGGMLGGVGEGVGRMANNAMLGDKADVNTNGTNPPKPGSGIGKAAGVFSAITGIVGAYLGGVGQSISAGWSIANGLLKSINKATLKIMDTSPIFKTIKDLLNLSFTMVFLPAMTLLQGKMLPIFVDLLNKAVVFGQQFAQEFLPYIPGLVADFQAVVNDVVDFFANNKSQLAEMVAGMVALLPTMMQLQLGLIKLFVDNKDKILDIANKTIETMKVFIDGGLLKNVLDLANVTTVFIMKYGVPMANATLSLAKFFVKSAEAIAGGLDNVSTGAYQGGITGAVSKGVSFLLGAAGIRLASGGYVPATPGGVPAIIGEGGEGEYVIPESKLNSIGGLTIVFSGNVYGMNDFKQQVRSIMNEYTTKANFR